HTDATYYEPTDPNLTHFTNAGSAASGALDKAFFDANTALLDGAIAAVGLGTMPALTTASATAAVQIQGSAVATLPALSASGTGVLPIQGAAVATLPALTGSGTGVLQIQATALATMPALSAIAAGVLAIVGQAIATLPALTSVASATTGG